jgi:predicted ester cyclase
VGSFVHREKSVLHLPALSEVRLAGHGTTRREDSLAAEDAKRVVSRFWEEVYNRGNVELIDEIVAPGYKLHDPVNGSDVIYGPSDLKSLLEGIRDFAPEARVNVEDQLAAEGDRVVTRFTVLVPRQNALEYSEPAGEPLELSGISISRVSSGMIEETWVNWDDHSLWEALHPPLEDWRWPPWR